MKAEQEGLNEILDLWDEDRDRTYTEIMDIMNESGILCGRIPGRKKNGDEIESKEDRRYGIEWTGKWTRAIIKGIIEREIFSEREDIIEDIPIQQKDERIRKEIKKMISNKDIKNTNYTLIAKKNR